MTEETEDPAGDPMALLEQAAKALRPLARKATMREDYAFGRGWKPEPDSHQLTHRLGDFRAARAAYQDIAAFLKSSGRKP